MFENKDFDSIMEEMLASVSDKLDKREGSIIYDAIAPIAMELAQTYIDMDMIVNDERVIIRTKLEKPSKIKGLALI